MSEGAGARTFSEDMDHEDISGLEKVLGSPMPAIKTLSIAVSSNQLPPAEPEGSRRRRSSSRCC